MSPEEAIGYRRRPTMLRNCCNGGELRPCKGGGRPKSWQSWMVARVWVTSVLANACISLVLFLRMVTPIFLPSVLWIRSSARPAVFDVLMGTALLQLATSEEGGGLVAVRVGSAPRSRTSFGGCGLDLRGAAKKPPDRGILVVRSGPEQRRFRNRSSFGLLWDDKGTKALLDSLRSTRVGCLVALGLCFCRSPLHSTVDRCKERSRVSFAKTRVILEVKERPTNGNVFGGIPFCKDSIDFPTAPTVAFLVISS